MTALVKVFGVKAWLQSLMVMTFAVLLFPASLAARDPSPTNHSSTPDDLPVAYPGYTGKYEGFTLVIDERFDKFDDTLWQKGDGAVGGEAMCRFQPQGVRVEDGLLSLVITREPIAPGWSEDHQQQKGVYDFSCGEIRLRPEKSIRYGRIETRMKAPARSKASGYISSLFTYNNNYDDKSIKKQHREWEEIDVELEGGRPDKFQANLIYGRNTWEWFKTRKWGAWEDKIEVGPVDEWRVFAIEWAPDAIRWYVDGQLVKTLASTDIDCKPRCVSPQQKPAQIPDNPTEIIMNFWIPVDAIQNAFGGNKKGNKYPMRSQYDWFRYYELDTQSVENQQNRDK